MCSSDLKLKLCPPIPEEEFRNTKLPSSCIEAESVDVTLYMTTSVPFECVSTSWPVRDNLIEDPLPAGLSRLADQTRVFSDILSNQIPTRYSPVTRG